MILKTAANLNDKDLRLLIQIVKGNSTKDKRWNAFKNSGLKTKFEIDYSISKGDFLVQDGLEASMRLFLSVSDVDSIELSDLRSFLLDAIPSGSKIIKNKTAKPEIEAKRSSKGSSNLVSCEDCGKDVSKNASSCPNCGNPINTSTKKSQNKNKEGNWCPQCGDRDSYKTTEGGGCLITGILFISIIGILFIPFLPKSWRCRSCGNIWK